MFDTDGNERVDKNEFLVVSNHIKALQRNYQQFWSSFIQLRLFWDLNGFFFCSKWLNFVRSIGIQRLIGLIRHL